MAVDKRYPDLPPITAVAGSMLIAIFDYGSDTLYRVPLSVVIPAAEGVEDYTWNPNIEYEVDDIVSRSPGEGIAPQLYISTAAENIGNLPEEPGSLFWTIAVRSASGLVPWVAGVFTDAHPVVLYDNGGGLSLYYLASATRPYNSTNIVNEINNGDWINLSDAGRKLRTAVIAGAFTQLDFKMHRDGSFIPSGDISAGVGNEFLFLNDDNAVHFTVLFNIVGTPPIIMPLNVIMSDGRWNSVDSEWTPLEAGKYKATFDYDGVNWWAEISQAPY